MFVFVMCSVTLGTLFLWKTITGSDNSITAVITASAAYSALVLALFLWRGWAELSTKWFRSADKSVLFWAGVAAVGTILPSTWMQEFLPELDESAADTFKSIVHAPMGYAVLCLFAPLVEETVFRGAILRSLLDTKMRPWAAICISAALFGVVHGNLAQMPHAFIIGILLGWMYHRTRSILPEVVLHWVNNTVVYATYVLAPQLEDITMSQLFGGNLRLALAMLCSLCILLPALFNLNIRMRR